MSNLLDLPPIHKIFIEYIVLSKIELYPKGLSGYQLRKIVNSDIQAKLNTKDNISPPLLSQSLIYRTFKVLKAKGYLNTENIVVNNRNQTLYILNVEGKSRLNKLRQTIQSIGSTEMDPSKFIDQFISGEISFVDLIPKHFPRDEVLKGLYNFRVQLKKVLENVERKIKELEMQN